MLGLFAAVPLSHEAQAAAPSKLRVNDVQYDSASQRFIIGLSCHAGMAGTDDKARSAVGIELIVNIGNGPWNSYQRGGDFEGTAIVVTKAVLKNRNGRDIGSVFVDITRYLQI
jgi:hypothetical protein